MSQVETTGAAVVYNYFKVDKETIIWANWNKIVVRGSRVGGKILENTGLKDGKWVLRIQKMNMDFCQILDFFSFPT